VLLGQFVDALGGRLGAASPVVPVAVEGFQPAIASFPFAALRIELQPRRMRRLPRLQRLGPGFGEQRREILARRRVLALGDGGFQGRLGLDPLGVEAGDGFIQRLRARVPPGALTGQLLNGLARRSNGSYADIGIKFIMPRPGLCRVEVSPQSRP
jgi:hypothetical protein